MKLITIHDNPLYYSGVGTMAGIICKELTEKHNFKIATIATALKNQKFDIVDVNDNWTLYPVDEKNIDGKIKLLFDLIEQTQPDAIWLMGDLHFFYWLLNIEDKIRSKVPLLYYHVWDNDPAPYYNEPLYKCFDYIGCISQLTHDIVKQVAPTVASDYIWHCVDEEKLTKIDSIKIKAFKIKYLNISEDSYVFLWSSRIAKRKQPHVIIRMFKQVVKMLGDRAVLIIHTRPEDDAQKLVSYINLLGLQSHIKISRELLTPELLNVMYNVADCVVNTSFAEGWGLDPTCALMLGKPIIVPQTGGLQDQFKKNKEGKAFGLIPIKHRNIVGAETAHYIHEDYVDEEKFVETMIQVATKTKTWVKNNYDFQWAQKHFKKENMVISWKTAIETSAKAFVPVSYRIEII